MYVLGDYVEEYGAVLAGGSVAGWGREGGGEREYWYTDTLQEDNLRFGNLLRAEIPEFMETHS
jgi:hypothetical protein